MDNVAKFKISGTVDECRGLIPTNTPLRDRGENFGTNPPALCKRGSKTYAGEPKT